MKAGAAPAKGAVSFADGSFIYTPNADANGADGFTIVIDDGHGGSVEQAVSVTINAINDAPVAAPASAITTDEDTASAAGAIGATDADGDTLAYSVKAGAAPAKGAVSFAGGSFIYTPNANANGADGFTIVIGDGHGGSAEQAVAVTISPVNDAPVANPDTGAAGENESKSFDVLANDTDADANDGKALVAVGAVSVSSSNPAVDGIDATGAFSIVEGQIRLDPGTLFDPLAGGETATVVVDYSMRDVAGLEASSTLTLTVNGAAEGPPPNIGTNAGEFLVGSAAGELIDARGGGDTVLALGGDDIVIGGAGNDVVLADGGNDTIVATINDGNDIYFGGSGSDTLDLSQTSAAATVTLGTSSDIGQATSAQIGTDILHSFENVIGSVGTDAISGDNLANVLRGGAGNDFLLGRGGGDMLDGGLGNDNLEGGPGDDMFVFQPGFGNDLVQGFDANPTGGQDRLDISAFGISRVDFSGRVAIADVGSATLVIIDGAADQTIRLAGIGKATTVTIDDFLLA